MDADYRRTSERLRKEIEAEGGLQWDARPSDMVDWRAEAQRSWCSRTWRAKWNLVPRGPAWLPEIIRLTWYLQVISVVIGLHSGIDGTLFQPFFWARTSCCGESGTPRDLPAKYDSHYPDTWTNYGVNVTKIKGCDVPLLPHNAPYWSHSPYCPNWNYVKDFTQDLSAKRNTYLTLAGAFFMPIGAGFADKQGRKPILFFNFLMGMKSLLINLLSSTTWLIHADPNAYLLYVSGLLSGMASSQGAVQSAMMVDVIPGELREQGFSIQALFGVPASLAVLGIGYYLLGLYLDNYLPFWIISFSTDTICMLFLLIFLPESMPDALRKPLEWMDLNPFRQYWSCLKVVFKYPLLICVVPCVFVSAFAGSGLSSVITTQLYLTTLKFTQSEMILPSAVGLLAAIPANILGAIIIPRIGVWPSIFISTWLSLAIFFGSLVFPIWYMIHHDCFNSTKCGDGSKGTILYVAKWYGPMLGSLLGAFPGAISGASISAMASFQVKQSEQAAVGAAFGLVSSVANMFAPIYFYEHYFDIDAKGWKVIHFGFAACAMWTVSNSLLMLAYWVHWYLYNANKVRTVTPRNKANGNFDQGVQTRRSDFHHHADNPLEIERKQIAQDYRREMVAAYGQVPSRRQQRGNIGSTHDRLL